MIIKYLKHKGVECPEKLLEFNTFHSPMLLSGMDKAVALMRKHSMGNVFVQVDCDADGFSSSAILAKLIKSEYPFMSVKYGYHEGKVHCLNEKLLDDSIDLVIIPDAGSDGDYSSVKADVLVLDHHLFTTEFVDQSGYERIRINCRDGYPNADLTGAGVVHKLVMAINPTLGEDLYDLAALGIQADLADARSHENQSYFNKAWNRIRNPFMSTALSGVYGGATFRGFSFEVAPLINSVVRVGSLADKQALFEGLISDDVSKVDYAISVCKECRKKQTAIRNRESKILKNKIEEECLDEKSVLVIKNADLHPNTRGLSANMVCSDYNKPVMVLSPAGDGMLAGSVRSPRIEDLSFIDVLNQSGLIEWARGHGNAFGVMIEESNLDALIEEITGKFTCASEDSAFTIVDFCNDDVNAILQSFHGFEFWGCNLERPVFEVKNVIGVYQPLGKRYSKFICGKNTLLCKSMKMAEKINNGEYENIFAFCENSCYNGKNQSQLVLLSVT